MKLHQSSLTKLLKYQTCLIFLYVINYFDIYKLHYQILNYIIKYFVLRNVSGCDNENADHVILTIVLSFVVTILLLFLGIVN